MGERGAVWAFLFSMLAFSPLAFAGSGMHVNSNQQSFLLLVIDFDDFMCPACMESMLDFCHALPLSLQQRRVWGVIVSDQANCKRQEGLSERILEKKIRGFLKANHLEFPIHLDQDGILVPLIEDGTAIFVFDREKQKISRHVFPLAPDEIIIIQESLGINYPD
jgi:hypothetical protein